MEVRYEYLDKFAADVEIGRAFGGSYAFQVCFRDDYPSHKLFPARQDLCALVYGVATLMWIYGLKSSPQKPPVIKVIHES